MLGRAQSLNPLHNGRCGGNRTPNRLIWNQVLCLIELHTYWRSPIGQATLSLPIFMRGVLSAHAAVFLQLKLRRSPSFARGPVVPALTLGALHGTGFSHGLEPSYSMIFVTTPAPTVRPPSRIAKRSSSSIAMGVISSPSMVTLSPGMTISAPPSNFIVPVTSVVRK